MLSECYCRPELNCIEFNVCIIWCNIIELPCTIICMFFAHTCVNIDQEIKNMLCDIRHSLVTVAARN